MIRSILFCSFFIATNLSAQDSIAIEKINTVFANLPVNVAYPEILAKAKTDSTFRIEHLEALVKNPSLVFEDTKVVLDNYPFYTEDKCTNCYISSFTKDNERTLRLTLHIETLNQERYNEIIKKVLAQITPFVKSIEKNNGAAGSGWSTWFLFQNNSTTPRIQIADPSKDFTRIVIDYVSEI